MLNPYEVVEETESTTTYQYNPLYSWLLIGVIITLVASMYSYIIWLQVVAVILIIFYFGAKLILGRAVSEKVRSALKSGSVELSGGKYSFSNPLKIKVPKNA